MLYAPTAIGNKLIKQPYVIDKTFTSLNSIKGELDDIQYEYLKPYTENDVPVFVFPHKGKTFAEVDPYAYMSLKDITLDKKSRGLLLKTSFILRMRIWDGTINKMDTTFILQTLFNSIDDGSFNEDTMLDILGYANTKEDFLFELFGAQCVLRMNFTGIPDLLFYEDMFDKIDFVEVEFNFVDNVLQTLRTNLDYIVGDFKGDATTDDFLKLINCVPASKDRDHINARFHSICYEINILAQLKFTESRNMIGGNDASITLFNHNAGELLKELVDEASIYLKAGIPVSLACTSGRNFNAANLHAVVNFSELVHTDKYLNKVGDSSYEQLLFLSAGFIMQHPSNEDVRSDFIDAYLDDKPLLDIINRGLDNHDVEVILYDVDEEELLIPFLYSKVEPELSFINLVMYKFGERTGLPGDYTLAFSMDYDEPAPQEVINFAGYLMAGVEEKHKLPKQVTAMRLAQYLYMYLLTYNYYNPLQYLEIIREHFEHHQTGD